MGDPIEIGALGTTFGTKNGNLALGAAKPNFAHALAASGLVGLAKCFATFCLPQPGLIGPVVHLRTLNRHCFATCVSVKLPVESLYATGVSVAGLSSFGFGGTNAHTCMRVGVNPVRLLMKSMTNRRIFQWREWCGGLAHVAEWKKPGWPLFERTVRFD